MHTSNIILIIEKIRGGLTLLISSKVLGVLGSLLKPLSLGRSHTDRLGGAGGTTEEVDSVTVVRVSGTTAVTVGVVLLDPGTTGDAVFASGVLDVIRVINDVTITMQIHVNLVVRHSHGTVIGLVVGNVRLAVLEVILEVTSQLSRVKVDVVTEKTIKLVILSRVGVTNVVAQLGTSSDIGPVSPGRLGGLVGLIDAVSPLEPTLVLVVGDLNVLNVDPLGTAVDEVVLRGVKNAALSGAHGRVTEVIDNIITVIGPEIHITISRPIEDVSLVNELGVRLSPEPHEVILTVEGTVRVTEEVRESTDGEDGGLDGVLGEGGDRADSSGSQADEGKGDNENAHHCCEKKRKEKREKIKEKREERKGKKKEEGEKRKKGFSKEVDMEDKTFFQQTNRQTNIQKTN